jgi:NOL1/NOP2/fmu family ribosome biogenesis protein
MQAEKFSSYLLERFGIVLPADVELVGDNSLRVMNRELRKFSTSTPKGIPASRMKGKFPKPTTAFIQVFGRLASKNVVAVGEEDAAAYLAGEDFEIGEDGGVAAVQETGDEASEPKIRNPELETGYVIVQYRGAVLGIGFCKEGRVENMLPKGRRIRKKKN